MCERRDSIAKMSAACDELSEACETAMQGPEPNIDPANPTRSGVSRAVRKCIRELSATPADMAVTLKKLK